MIENMANNGWGSITPPNLFNPEGIVKVNSNGVVVTGKNLVLLKTGGFIFVSNNDLAKYDQPLFINGNN